MGLKIAHNGTVEPHPAALLLAMTVLQPPQLHPGAEGQPQTGGGKKPRAVSRSTADGHTLTSVEGKPVDARVKELTGAEGTATRESIAGGHATDGQQRRSHQRKRGGGPRANMRQEGRLLTGG